MLPNSEHTAAAPTSTLCKALERASINYRATASWWDWGKKISTRLPKRERERQAKRDRERVVAGVLVRNLMLCFKLCKVVTYYFVV